MGDVAACIGRFEPFLVLRIPGVGRAEYALDHRSLQKPAGLLLGRGRSLDVLPCHMIDSGGTGGFDRGFIVADNCNKVAIAHEFDGPLGRAAYGTLIN